MRAEAETSKKETDSDPSIILITTVDESHFKILVKGLRNLPIISAPTAITSESLYTDYTHFTTLE